MNEEELYLRISGSDSPDKLKEIRECHFFIAHASDAFLASAQNFAECFYAKELGKPFRVIIKKGTKITKGYFEGVSDIKFYEWETRSEKELCYRELLSELREHQKKSQKGGDENE